TAPQIGAADRELTAGQPEADVRVVDTPDETAIDQTASLTAPEPAGRAIADGVTVAAVPPSAGNMTASEISVAAIDLPVDAGPVPLREAASAGDARALFEVASRYAEGRGTRADMTRA